MALWLLLLQLHVCMVTAVTYIEDMYEVDQTKGEFSHLVIEKTTGRIFVGATNWLYEFNKDLNKVHEIITGPKKDNPLCNPRMYTDKCDCSDDGADCSEKYMENYNKGLVIDYDRDQLIACSSLFHGYCERYHLNNMRRVEPTNYFPVVANNATASTVIFIGPGPVKDKNSHQGSVLYVGATRTINGPLVTRDRFVPSFCSRKLDGDEVFRFVFLGISTSTRIQIDSLLRGSFPIHYIYGFSHDIFSYMITIQKSSPTIESYITKIVRVCSNDVNFYSYTEVQLHCKHTNGKKYNLAQAAFFGKAGIKLARTVGQGEDYLYVVFASGNTNSAETNADSTSALCIYPMRDIKHKFTKNIQQCFEGYGNTGPAHVISTSKCSPSQYNIEDDYCGNHNFNYYIDGTIIIEADAAATFDSIASAVTIDIVNEYTVAFIGNVNGHLLKVSLEGQSNGSIYEDVAVDEGNKINADMFLDNKPGQYVYVMTPRRLLKTKLYECSQYTSCVTCLGAKDPYCGWCSLQNKCSLKTECQAYNSKLSWLPYINFSCPRIERVSPEAIQLSQKTATLDVTVSSLLAVTTGNYECVFSHGNIRLATTNSSLKSRPSGNSSNIFRCETPESFKLPPIPTGEDHIVMNLSVKIAGMDVDFSKFTFFDCELHTDTACTGCTLSNFPCTWCVDNHICTHNPTQKCQGNTLITGSHNNSHSGALIGPGACPRIELEGALDGELLVPSGTKMKIPVKVIHLKNFQLPLSCFFPLIPVVTVPATVTKIKGEEWEVQCDEVEFKYHGDSSQINVPFQIFWANSLTLDNPERIQVIMYKCDAMASFCGDCLMIKHSYKCGWCGDTCITPSAKCSPEKWHDYNSTCPDPGITKITPLTGPVSGGTRLTIEGYNLGKEPSDVLGGVTVAGVACNLVSDAYEPPSKIVCETGPFANKKSGEVTVSVGNMYQAVAPEFFTYVNPRLESVTPGSGPVSGGTKVTIKGQHLNAGSNVEIKIDNYTCKLQEREEDSLTCKTIKANAEDLNKDLRLEAKFDREIVKSSLWFKYINDPVVNETKKHKAIVSGGIPVRLLGKYLNTVQCARMILEDPSVDPVKTYYSECNKASQDGTEMTCYSPQLPNTTLPPDSSTGKEFRLAFQMDNIKINRTGEDPLDKFIIFPDPVFIPFPGNKEKALKKADYLTINGRNLHGITEDDVTVRVGTKFCNVTSLPPSGTSLLCKPPQKQPQSRQGSKYPEVIIEVGRNYSVLVGYLKYENEGPSLPMIIGIGAGALALIVFIFVILWCVKRREQMTIQKKWQIQMDNLEGKVAKECKEAFAELLTDMTDLANNDFGNKVSIPFLNYRTYCMRVLFPQDEETHPVVRELEIEYSKRENIERGLKLFSQLIGNKTFLLNFVRTLESNKSFQMRDRVNVASLISVALQTKMEYATEILKMLLSELIEKSVDGKNHPRLLLRRTESVAEKMLTNWFTFLLYKFLRDCAGETLFVLYEAIKQQVSKGPVDFFTSEARYSLSEDKLIRQQVDYIQMTIQVRDLDQFSQSHPVKVLDCDTITQVKEKILDAIYKNAPYSSRPTKESVDLVLFAQSSSPEWENTSKQQRLILSDLDATSKTEGEYKRFNTLAHYQVPDGAFMALVQKQTANSVVNISLTAEKSGSSKPWDYQRLGDSNYVAYTGRSPSLNRTGSPSSAVDLENGSGNGVKYYHLVKQHDSESNKEGDRSSKMVSEVFLTRLLATKGTLQSFVNDLFERIFSTTHRGHVLPLAIKYMFDFLDDQALLHNIQDPDVVHTWKSNSLPLRFWVNVIKNPNFVFDIYKSNIVDSCLSVVAQNFMDSCSMSEVRLGKDSPSSKLLYAKNIPEYKKWVERYYQDIKMMPAISDQDMTAMMAEESRTHQDEFNTNAALLELYKYVQAYRDDLVDVLDEDEFARKNRLNLKLEQVHIAMNGEAYC